MALPGFPNTKNLMIKMIKALFEVASNNIIIIIIYLIWRWLAIPAMPHPVALAGAVVVRGEVTLNIFLYKICYGPTLNIVQTCPLVDK